MCVCSFHSDCLEFNYTDLFYWKFFWMQSLNNASYSFLLFDLPWHFLLFDLIWPTQYKHIYNWTCVYMSWNSCYQPNFDQMFWVFSEQNQKSQIIKSRSIKKVTDWSTWPFVLYTVQWYEHLEWPITHSCDISLNHGNWACRNAWLGTTEMDHSGIYHYIYCGNVSL